MSTIDRIEPAIPPGYAACELRLPYGDLIGPLYRRVLDGHEWLGLRLEPRHANRAPMAHGGLIASLADIIVGRAAMQSREPRQGCLTVSLAVDYLQSAPIGRWLDGCATPDRIGSSLGFVSCKLYADGELVAQARSVLKYLSPSAPKS